MITNRRLAIWLFTLLTLVFARSLHEGFVDFQSGENDLIPATERSPLDTTSLGSLPLPIVPERVSSSSSRLTTPLAFQAAVHSFSHSDDSPKDPFVDDPSSGQSQNAAASLLLNERLLAKQTSGGFERQKFAVVNELPLSPPPSALQPIVPEILVRGTHMPDARFNAPSRINPLFNSMCRGF